MSSRPTSAQPAVDLDALLLSQTVWKANRAPATADALGESTGHAALDAALPQRGWPKRALTELLLPADGIGELTLLLPTLARFTQAGGIVALVAPPYLPYAPAWQSAGVDLRHLEIIDADPRNALWAFEQCLRSAACAAVIGWPLNADGPSLRRLQVAADTGDCLGFALRDRKHAANPSPAALRMEYVPSQFDADDAMATTAPMPMARMRLPSSAIVPVTARELPQEPLHPIARIAPRGADLPAPMTRSLSLFPVSEVALQANDDIDMPPASFVDLARLRALAASARARNERASDDAAQRSGCADRPPSRDHTARGNWHVRKCRGGNLPLRGVALQRLN